MPPMEYEAYMLLNKIDLTNDEMISLLFNKQPEVRELASEHLNIRYSSFVNINKIIEYIKYDMAKPYNFTRTMTEKQIETLKDAMTTTDVDAMRKYCKKAKYLLAGVIFNDNCPRELLLELEDSIYSGWAYDMLFNN